jgi:putative DNA primase/helicase
LKQPERVYVALDDVAAADFSGDGTPYGLAVMHDELDRVRVAQVGTRNHQLNRSAFALARLVAGGELLESAARSSLLGVSLAIGLDEPESRQTIDSAFDAGVRQPRVAPHRIR